MAVLQAGSTVTMAIGGADLILGNINPLSSRITNALAGVQPALTVNRIDVQTSYPLGSIVSDTYQYVATISVTTAIDFVSADVVLPAVMQACYTATNFWPNSGAVASVNGSGTGTPTPVVPSSALDPLTNLWNSLNALGPIVIGTLVIGIGVVLYLVIEKPKNLRAILP